MPSSISYSSVPPKFPDKQRRPGIIQLPQALPAPQRPSSKPSGLSAASQKPSQQPSNVPELAHKRAAQSQPRSPNPASRPKSASQAQAQSGQRRKQKRSQSGSGNIALISDESAVANTPPTPEAAATAASVTVGARAVQPGSFTLSPPPTPAQRANHKNNNSSRNKSKKAAAAAAGHARKVSQPMVLSLPMSPPLTPEAFKFAPVSVEKAVFAPLSPPFEMAQDMAESDDSLPLADEDEIIVWKQPQTPTSFTLPPAPKQRAPGTPSRSPSPSEFFNWEEVKNLPRLSPTTIAQLKEQYDIRPSEAFQQTQNNSREPDLLMSLLNHSSASSAPPSRGGSPDASSVFSSPSKPISIRRPGGSHARAPSFPAYPTSGRLAMMQYKEDIAEAFGLDARDELAVQKATEAWRAYAGSSFNHSPETNRMPAPRFLGRLF